MKMRGPGELVGLKQAGIPSFSFLNVINDYKIFVVARDDAKEIMKDKNNPDYQKILRHAEFEVNKNSIIKG